MVKYGFDHIHLRTPDVEATAAWYERVLGAQIIRSMQNGKPRAICFPLEDGDDPLLAEQAWRRARFGLAPVPARSGGLTDSS